MPHKRWMTAKEAAHLQGFGANDLNEFKLDNLADSELRDLVGNAFATTVLSAVIVGAMLSWSRE
jgi:hypothetical protein